MQFITFDQKTQNLPLIPKKKEKKERRRKKGPVQINRHKLSVNRLIYIKKQKQEWRGGKKQHTK